VIGWRPCALTVETDPARGGRWTSLRTPEREWLWRNPDPAVARARAAVRPGAAFVDAGGVEECIPTVRGEPDHGDAWSRPWTGDGDTAEVQAGALRLARRFGHEDVALRVGYTVSGPPHTPFVHAVHALLDVSPAARLQAPGIRTAHLLDRPADRAVVAWPGGDDPTPLDHLGPDDGTATAAVLPGCTAATVLDGDDALVLTWASEQPCALLLWRNLRGWPAEAPYRSIGIEPMVGTTAALDDPAPGRPARLDPAGELRWQLTVTAWRRAEPGPRARPRGSGKPLS
jgi:hypothetical protein